VEIEPDAFNFAISTAHRDSDEITGFGCRFTGRDHDIKITPSTSDLYPAVLSLSPSENCTLAMPFNRRLDAAGIKTKK